MKKLFLLLLVVALAAFLFVGCIPVTPGEGEGEGEGELEVTITFENEYTDAKGVTFIPCSGEVTVTLSAPVAVDNVVYVALKEDDGDYDCSEPLTPNADRTVWTGDYTPNICSPSIDECEPFCVVALVKHPCCPGEEVALKVVRADCTPPTLDLFVKFSDCTDPCVDPDPCVEPFAGVSMEWTSRTTSLCETTDCCADNCSGVGGWSLVIDPDECEGPCDTVEGTGCHVEGELGCECFAYADTGEVCYIIEFTLEDNVGNAVESKWELCLDTDSVVSFSIVDGDTLTADSEGWYTVYNDCQP